MTILFSLCYLGGNGEDKEHWRLERCLKWLNYMKPLQNEFGFDKIVLCDNASDENDLLKLHANIFEAETKKQLHSEIGSIIDVYRYKEFLPRLGMLDYPYCWRGMKFLQNYIKEKSVEKVQMIDLDCYILSKRMANFFRDEKTGWQSFHCHKYDFPEAALQLLCKDSFETFCNFPINNFSQYKGLPQENLLPFTDVHKNKFIGDRYGEVKMKQQPQMDYYAQWNLDCDEMKFNF